MNLVNSIKIKGALYRADVLYEPNAILERAKRRVAELEEQGIKAVYRKVRYTEGSEEGYMVYVEVK